MKRTSKDSNSYAKRIQRSNIRRAQATGRKRASAQARRSAKADIVPQTSLDNAGLDSAGEVVVSPRLQRWFVSLIAAVAIVGILIVALQNAPRWLEAAANERATATAAVANETRVAAAATESANRIGIVSGHRGNDSGALCNDGLTEAQVNFDHATRVADFLRAQGYVVDILDEFDPRLNDYRALALLSIHADSCAYINELATGFKVARAVESRVPETEDKLVACLTSRYKKRTGLRFHANTVTFDMTKYHAFYEIDQATPAAIIETGFMYLDRPLLTRKPEVVAQGIADGLLCFLRDESP